MIRRLLSIFVLAAAFMSVTVAARSATIPITAYDTAGDALGNLVDLAAGDEYTSGVLPRNGLSFDDFYGFTVPATGLGASGFAAAITATGSFSGTVDLVNNLNISIISGPLAIAFVGAGVYTVLIPFVLLADASEPFLLSVVGAFTGNGNYTVSLTTTPIPGAFVLFLTALAGVGWLGRRKSRLGTA